MVLGTAKWSEVHELRIHKLLQHFKATEPHRGLFLGFWREPALSPDFEPIRYEGDLHQLIVAGTGGGKFTSALAPLLLASGFNDHAVVAIDPKGEMARLAGPFFQKPFAEKQTVFLLDPWDECATGKTASLNVLDQIRPDNPRYVDDARALADALIIPSGSPNTHWDNTGVNFLAAIILHVALDPKETRRDLLRVRELVTLSWALPKGFAGPPRPTLSSLVMQNIESKLAGGAIAHGFTGIMNREDKERSGILSSIERDTVWLDSPQMGKVVRDGTVDLREAALGTNKYFVVIPPDFFNTHRGWLRLMITSFANAMKRYKHKEDRRRPPRWRHIIIDEFTNLGEMRFMLQDVSVARGYAIKYHLAVQGLSQLKATYGDDWESFINNTFQRVFAVGDMFTAEYVSRKMGMTTFRNVTHTQGDSASAGHGLSDGFSTSMGAPGSMTRNSGRSSSENSGWSESYSVTPAQRPLATPDEITRNFAIRNQILLFRGPHPIQNWRPNYWEAFESLPEIPLEDVLATVGRTPTSDEERDRFAALRDEPVLIGTKPPLPAASMTAPAPVPRLEAVSYGDGKAAPSWKNWLIAVGMISIALVGLKLLEPSSPPKETRVVETAPPPEQKPKGKLRPILITRPIPSLESIRANNTPSTAARDYLIRLVRAQIKLCEPSHTKDEIELIKTLLFAARDMVPSNLDTMLKVRDNRRMFALETTRWGAKERSEAFELIISELQANRTDAQLTSFIMSTVPKLYAGGTCPFGQLSATDYQQPTYIEFKKLTN